MNHFVAGLPSQLVVLAWLSALAACGSTPATGSPESLPAANGGSGGRVFYAGAPGTAGGSSGAGRVVGTAGSAGAPTLPARGDPCTSGDACATCLCQKCPEPVSNCKSTAGCQAIAECVQSHRCQGIDCYCGSAPLLACANGQASGPCRDVILSAPGARKPTLNDQSAGPAADAAIRVGTCGTQANTDCTASCQ